MKIHLLPNGFIMVGKAWEIRAKLKEYNRSFETVEQWVNAHNIEKRKRLGQKRENWRL